MVSDMDVIKALPAVQGSWIAEYVTYSASKTAAPLIYHLGVAFAALSATCAIDYGGAYAGTTYSIHYALCVGRAGEDFKTASINIAQDLLQDAAPSLLLPAPRSAEGMIETLKRQPVGLWPAGELGDFFARAKEGGYMAPVKTKLTELWDGRPAPERSKKEVITVDRPRQSLAAACSLSFLETHTEEADWDGGFMSRWLILYGKSTRMMPDPKPDLWRVPALVEGLRVRASIPHAGYCTGLTPRAQRMWDDWYADLYKRKLPSKIGGARSRTATVARRVLLAYGWDYGPAPYGQPWEADLDLLEPSIAFAELHYKSVLALSDYLVDSPDARLRRKVIRAFEEYGPMTKGQVLAVTQLRPRTIQEILGGLVEEGKLQAEPTAQGTEYHPVIV